MVLRGGLVDVDDIHLFPGDRDGFDPQNEPSAHLRSVVLTCVSFVFGEFSNHSLDVVNVLSV
jgi:hypothetical protein